jgi:hypothetical protein
MYELAYHVTNQELGQRWHPQLKDKGYDAVLPGQDSHISKEVVTDECGAMAAW